MLLCNFFIAKLIFMAEAESERSGNTRFGATETVAQRELQ